MLSLQTTKNLHVLALLLLSLPLLGAFGIQIFMHEFPCPLCILQRVGMLGVAVGLLMNLKFGIKPIHYGVSILSALVGAGVATRQILLHIVPTPDGITGFGDPVLGLHLYTWSLVVFLASILGMALLMIFYKNDENENEGELTGVQKAIFILFITLAVTNAMSAFLECGLSPCPENPTKYKML